jgi:putative FmdB family regulatory protein
VESAPEVDIMPSYEYACRDCKKDFTIFLSLKELEAKPKITCPHCESDNVEKRFTGFFAKTDKKS